MEMCNGGDLQFLLDTKGGFLSEYEALFVLLQIARGVVDMHDQ